MKAFWQRWKKRIAFLACVFGYIAIQVLVIMASRIGIAAFNGVLMACQFALCLLLVRNNHKKGIIASYIMMGLSTITLLREVIVMHKVTPIPGLFNSIIYIVTLSLLAWQFQIRENEAITDFLTGLLNRRGLYQLLQERVALKKSFHVIYVDLGNFKMINDNFGHTCGDDLMKIVSKRMEQVVGRSGIITRIGGDEFVVVINGELDPAQIANCILEKIREKVTLEADGSNIDCYLATYAGIASYPTHTEDYESLIKYADMAMYRATKDKMTEPCFFDKQMEQKLRRRLEIEKLIKEGLVNDYFYLVYQPQYLLEGKKLRGFESLLRMRTPEGEEISPGEFIPVAEKGELILQIDDYVLHRAMREFKDIVKNKNQDLIISINVSAKNIGALDFAEKVNRLLEETDFPAKNLEIEITEYCLVQSVDTTIDNIKKMREKGVQVALDDFGTGYTSLSYLAKMPINLLKIDKSLIDDIESSQKSRDFVQAVVSMGHLMGCEVISEGVEAEGQLKLLDSHDCDFIQGYIWGKPLSYEEAVALATSKK